MRSNEFDDIEKVLEEVYELTPKGFISTILGMADTEILLEQLKHYMDNNNYNCIIFNGDKTEFIKVEKEWDSEEN